MKQTITFSIFVDTFIAHDRKDQFSYEALKALYDYLEETDPDYDLDVVELCGQYTESTIDEVGEYYAEANDMSDKEILEWLNERTFVVSENPLVYVNF
jgi:hypothetical protein